MTCLEAVERRLALEEDDLRVGLAADLRSYVRIPGVATWSGGVRSFWAGTWGGFFGVWPNGSLFYSLENVSSVDSIVAGARYLTFSSHAIDMAH